MKAKTKLKLASLTDEYNMLVQLLIALQEGGGNEPTKKGVLFWNETEDIGVKKGKDGEQDETIVYDPELRNKFHEAWDWVVESNER